jgi:hypothetical protein
MFRVAASPPDVSGMVKAERFVKVTLNEAGSEVL